MKKIFSFIVLSFCAVAPMFAQSKGVQLFERGYSTEWTNDDATKWGNVTSDPVNVGTEVLDGYGLHTGHFDQKTYIRIAASATDTIAPNDATRGILNVEAQWVSYGSVGRAWFDNATTKALLNCAYFRVGNVYLMQNGQVGNMAYSTDDLKTYTVFDINGMTGLSNVWGGRIYDISTIPFINIKMKIDMPHNKLDSLVLSSAENPNDTLFVVANVDIKNQDWSKIILGSGFHKTKSINGSPNEFLKALKIVETTQAGEKTKYSIDYMLDGVKVNPSEEKQGFVGESVKIPETFWLTDAATGKQTKYYVKEPKDVVLNSGSETQSIKFDVRKAENYICLVTSDFGKVLVKDTIVEGEAAPYVYWNKFVKNDKDGCWYESQAPFGMQSSSSENTSNVVSFTKSNISYFYDTSDMYVKQSHSGVSAPVMESTNYSGGFTQRHLAYDPVWFAKEVISDGGVFEVSVPWINGHTSASYIELDTYKDTISDDLSYEVGKIAEDYLQYNTEAGIQADARKSGVATIQGFEVPLNSGVTLTFAGSDNSNACLDYVAMTWKDYLRETVVMEDEMVDNRTQQKSNIATTLRPFVCDKNYIFSKCDDVTAYYLKDIKLGEKKNSSTGEMEKTLVAEFDSIEGAASIGTICVLAGEAGATAKVPYVNHSDFNIQNAKDAVNSVWTEDLRITKDGAGVDTSSSKVYCLEVIDGVAKFVEVADGNIPDGVVYFTVPNSVIEENNITSQNISCTYMDGEPAVVTGIRSVASEKADNYGIAYNLNGQRVYATAKGLVIVNGKKSMNK